MINDDEDVTLTKMILIQKALSISINVTTTLTNYYSKSILFLLNIVFANETVSVPNDNNNDIVNE